MNLPLKIILSLLFPLISSIILIVFPRPKRSYIISGLLFLISILVFSIYQPLLFKGLGNDIIFPLIFSTENLYANLVRFAIALTGSVILAYNAHKKSLGFHLLSIWALSSALIITLAESFLTFFLFWELLTLTTTGIVFLGENKNNYKKGLIYLLTHLSGGLFLLTGIIINYSATGSLMVSVPQAGIPFFVLGIGVKTAFLPLHFWLIKGYPAASRGGSVLLSALSTKAGVYAVARILEPSLFVAYMGGLMAVFGVIMALQQKKLRPLLSYHIISQVGYMVAGIGSGFTLSTDAGLLHLLNHMLYKALLFMSAGAVIYATGTEEIKKLGSLWRKIPVTFGAGMIGSLAISGIPPFNGFISKTMLKYGIGEISGLSVLLLAAGVGTVISFCKFMYFTFVIKEKEKSNFGKMGSKTIKRVSWHLKVPMLITSLIIVILGVYPQILQRISPYQSSTFIYSFSSIKDALIIAITGVVIFSLLIPFLNPAQNKFSINFYKNQVQKLSVKVDNIILMLQEKIFKKHLLSFSNSLWILLFSFSFILSFFMVNLIFLN